MTQAPLLVAAIFRHREGSGTGLDQAPDQRGQMEMPVDPALRFGGPATAVRTGVDGVIAAAHRRLDVCGGDVHPAERLQFAGPALADDDRAIAADLRSSNSEAGQAVGDHVRAGMQREPGPSRPGLALEVVDSVEAH